VRKRWDRRCTVRGFNNSAWKVISKPFLRRRGETEQVETAREDLTMMLGPNSMGASVYPSLIDFDCLDPSCGSYSTAPAFVSSKLTRLCARVDRPLPVYPLVVPPPSGCHQRPTTSKSAGLGSRMRYPGELGAGIRQRTRSDCLIVRGCRSRSQQETLR
jgi:hypothetical protein